MKPTLVALTTVIALAACGSKKPGEKPDARIVVPDGPPPDAAFVPSTSFWVPFAVQPIATGGVDGVYVVPSNAPTTAPVLVGDPTTTFPFSVATGYGYTAHGYVPQTAMYVASAGSSSDSGFVYALALDDVSATPVATQLSTVPVPRVSETRAGVGTVPGVPGCDGFSGFSYLANLNDPTTLFTLIAVPPTPGGTCSPATEVFDLFRYSGGDPVAVGVIEVGAPVYTSNGELAGLVSVDSTGALSLWQFDRATYKLTQSPTPLVTGLDLASTFAISTSPDHGEVIFEAKDTAGGAHLYGVSANDRLVLKLDLPSGQAFSPYLNSGGIVQDASSLCVVTSNTTDDFVYCAAFDATATTPTTAAQVLDVITSTAGSASLVGLLDAGATVVYETNLGSAQAIGTVTNPGGAVTSLGATPISSFNVFVDTSGTYVYGAARDINLNDSTWVATLTAGLPAVSSLGAGSSTFAFGGSTLLSSDCNAGQSTTAVRSSLVLRQSNVVSGQVGDQTYDVIDTPSTSDASLLVGYGGSAFAVPSGYTVNNQAELQCTSPSGPDVSVFGYAPPGVAGSGAQAAILNLEQNVMAPVAIPGASATTTGVFVWGLQTL